MPLELGVWRIDQDLTRLGVTALDNEARLEDILDRDIGVVSPNLMIIGRQVRTEYGGFIDLVAVDASGRLAVLELKRDKTPREIVSQLLDYASWVRHLDNDDIARMYDAYLRKYHPDKQSESIDDAFRQRFNVASPPDSLNTGHDLIVVASALDASTERIVSYLADEHGVAINAVFFRVFRDENREYLANTWLMDPTQPQPPVIDPIDKKWNGEFYCSFGEGPHRRWDDAVKFGFFSAGGGSWYSRTLYQLVPGNRIWVNAPGRGYVGVGEVMAAAVLVGKFKVHRDGASIPIMDTGETVFSDVGPEHEEHLVRVQWTKTVSLEDAISEKGFFGNQNSVCKPTAKSWQHTVDRLKQKFGVE